MENPFINYDYVLRVFVGGGGGALVFEVGYHPRKKKRKIT